MTLPTVVSAGDQSGGYNGGQSGGDQSGGYGGDQSGMGGQGGGFSSGGAMPS